MKFKSALIPGKLIKRYNRFLCDVLLLTGEEIIAHCPNPGSMLGLKSPGSQVWLSPTSGGKLSYRWELIETKEGLVGINTFHPNVLVQEAIENQNIRELQGYTSLKREVKYGINSRIDFLLESDQKPSCYIEVKNVHLKRENLAEFPDSITARGAKHLQELSKVVQQGYRAVLIYVVQRMDCKKFTIAADIDPVYASMAELAKRTGVEFLCYQCHISTGDLYIEKKLEIIDL